MTRRGWLMGGIALLAGCASLPPPAAPPEPDLELLEPILGAWTETDGLTIAVRSHGCTSRTDFAFYVDRRGAIPAVAFGRRQVDVCQGPIAPMRLRFSFDELGLASGAETRVLNPLEAP